MHFLLIDANNKRIVDEFDAVDIPAARPVAVQKCQAAMQKCILAVAVRMISPQSQPPAVVTDDSPIP